MYLLSWSHLLKSASCSGKSKRIQRSRGWLPMKKCFCWPGLTNRKVGRGSLQESLSILWRLVLGNWSINTIKRKQWWPGQRLYHLMVWNIWWAHSFNGFVLDSSPMKVLVNNLPFLRGRGRNHRLWVGTLRPVICWSSSCWLEPWTLLVATGYQASEHWQRKASESSIMQRCLEWFTWSGI